MTQEPLNSKPKKSLSRRDFLYLLKFLGLEAFLLTIGGGLYMREYEPSLLEIKTISLNLPRLSKSFSGFRLVQLSDLHYGGWMTGEYLDEVIQAVIAQSPDLVVLTGDYVMGNDNIDTPRVIRYLSELADRLKVLSDAVRVLSVLGNHDHWLDSEAVIAILKRAGIQNLSNSVFTLQRNDEMLHIAGVDDVMEHHADMDTVLAQLPAEGCAILLAHEPDYADVSALTGRFDLQLSGHSHGGQVVLPWIGPPILPHLGRIYPRGLYRVKDMYQYTNRGIGMSHPYFRLNCRPEITVFTLGGE